MTVSILNKDVKEGDIVEFGRYMQKNDNDMDNIEWNVLDVKDGKALLLSRYALDFKQYNEKFGEYNWAQCSLRRWLNSDFLNAAFNDEEKKLIVLSTLVQNETDNFEYAPKENPDTQDYVFCLSQDEIVKYFSQDGQLYDFHAPVAATEYLLEKGKCYTHNDYLTDEGKPSVIWWTRSPSFDEYAAATVCNYSKGYETDEITTNFDQYPSVDRFIPVRPALWISLS